METTLVTGATGLIGYNIVDTLIKRGRKVRVLLRSIEKGKLLLPNECEFVQGDITDKASLEKAVKGCSVIYHSAGFPEQWMRDPNIFQEVNVQGTKNIAEIALQEKVKSFIYTSTIDVFQGESLKEYDESIIDPEPKGTYYERSKQQADQIVVEVMKKGLPAIFIHPSAVYGPGPASLTSPGINHMIQDLCRGKLPALLPGGFPVVYAPDVGLGHVLAEEKAAIGERYILSESYQTLEEVAQTTLGHYDNRKRTPMVVPLAAAKCVSFLGEKLATLTNRPPLIPKGQLHFLQWNAYPQSKKAQQELDWSPLPFKEGIKNTIDFLKEMNQN
ncbi:SDR family NAD(P)-dependent oxidoreductase [Xanthovirga aplysinae]|uniref:SDR family NAD(P)-dependent oxidoreductase n=1 Tax=Xanthovirga aplysinae TaxID=2529853 RepID=UPI0012BCE3AB|nr:SDR family NAD(P)-dependent oxidoreductase [Xanthovirga aplysinae]MTI30933.1 SDR family NAD(P)-dependent oxidoreductase [Xanthovirga aplysinae]